MKRSKNQISQKTQHDTELEKNVIKQIRILDHWLYDLNMQIERKSKGIIDSQLTLVLWKIEVSASQFLELDPATNRFLLLEGLMIRLKKKIKHLLETDP